jgi:hypothetical protein
MFLALKFAFPLISQNGDVVNARFHLNVFSTQIRVSPYIPKQGRDKMVSEQFALWTVGVDLIRV